MPSPAREVQAQHRAQGTRIPAGQGLCPRATRLFLSARGGLGDLILLSPVFRALRRLYPAARMTLLTDPQGRDFGARYGWFDEVVSYRRGLRAGYRLFQILRRQDAVISLDLGQRSTNLAWLARVPVRAGANGHRSRHLTCGTDMRGWDQTSRYQPETAAEIIRRSLGLDLGAIADLRDLAIPAFSAGELQRAETLIRERVRDPEHMALVAPFTAVHHREWPLAYYRALIRRLKEDLGACPVVIAGQSERDRALAGALDHCVNLAGQTTFMEMAALVAKARLLVGSCSGHAHVAAALRRPAVILYGPSSPARFAHPAWTTPVSLGLDCTGCVDRSGNAAACAERPCLTGLTADTVFEACRRRWLMTDSHLPPRPG